MMRLRNDDRGAALITVVVLGFVMMVLIGTGLTVATSGLRQADGVQRSTSALDAAFAGAQDYLARVNMDPTYVRYGNTASSFSAKSTLAIPTPWNPAFGVGTPTGIAATDTAQHRTWAVVPGSDSTAKFRYEVDTTAYATTGIVRLRVTGLAGSRTRTLLASVRVKGFVDYAYFTDYEIQDPATYVNDDAKFDPTACVKYAWAGRSATCTNRMGVQFSAKDVIYGDVHSNDTISVCDTTFSGVVETANTTNPLIANPQKCANKNINVKSVATLPMPSSNTTMKQTAKCVYTGPTQVTYNADGTMTVVSPWTKYTSITGTPSNPTACGTPAGLHSTGGATVPQLADDALYVQSVPALASDPNYASAKPSWVTCVGSDGVDTSDSTGNGWEMTGGGKTIRYPLVGEAPATGWVNSQNALLWNTATPAYGCRNGDLYVSGRVTTQTTAASDNYVYVVGDLTYADSTVDVLGLVGQNAVIVWNPMSAVADMPMLATDFNRKVSAAILSVAHTFQVQNYDRGATRGALQVFGSIGQKFRGPVVTFDPDTGAAVTGYTKAYQYDTLLKTVSPPKFLAPSSTSFSITRYASVPAAFTPQGVQR